MSTPNSFRVVHAAENIKGGVGTYLRDLVVAQRASFGAGSVVVVVPRSQSDVLESPAGVEVITFDDRGPRWRSTLRLAARMREVMAHAGAMSLSEVTPRAEPAALSQTMRPSQWAPLSQGEPSLQLGPHSQAISPSRPTPLSQAMSAPGSHGASLLSGVAAPCVVHLHSTFAGLALRPLLRWAPTRSVRMARGARMPRGASMAVHCAPVVVYCAHGWSFDRETSAASRRLAMTLERAFAPLCDAIVCISEHEMRIARQARIAAPTMAHIANGIPLNSLAPAVMSRPDWPSEKRRVLFVGRFDRQKGVDILLEALRELRDSTFAYLVGSPVLGDGASLNLPDNVRTTGWLSASDLTAYYETADVLVAPSRWEGFGLTAVEAMRAGLPVVAARVGGLAEVVDHGVTGLLVDPNSSAALVNAIRSTSTESLKSMGEAGRQRFVERFTLDRMHVQLTALYQRLHAQRAAVREHLPRGAAEPAQTAQPEGSRNA